MFRIFSVASKATGKSVKIETKGVKIDKDIIERFQRRVLGLAAFKRLKERKWKPKW